MSLFEQEAILGTIYDYLPEESWFHRAPWGIHGAVHTTRVLIWSAVLASMIGSPTAIRRSSLLWAASVHDVMRIDDGKDREHGERSAVWAGETLPVVRPLAAQADIGIIQTLCRGHVISDHRVPELSLELVILKDAGALDRVRLGWLDERWLRLAASQRLVKNAARLEQKSNRYGEITVAETIDAFMKMEVR